MSAGYEQNDTIESLSFTPHVASDLSEFRQTNVYSPWNHQKKYGLLMVSGEKEVN